MDCKETNKLFTAYLGNELSGDDRRLVQAHMASCSDCQKEIEALSATQTKFRQTLKMVTDSAEPSGEAWAKLREQIVSEKEQALARVLPARETWWERMGRASLIPRRLTLRTATAGLLALILIIVASIAIPALTGHDEKALASEIALANPDVRAALDGITPAGIAVAVNIDSSGTSRVILTMPPDRTVIADVNTKKQTVTQVIIQSVADITPELVIDIAKADPRVQNILKMGYNIYYGGAGEFNLSLFQDTEAVELLKPMGINNPQDLIGFSAAMMLKFHSGDYDGYLVWVNVSIGKVAGIADHPFTNFGTVVTKTVTNTVITYP